MDRIKDKAHGIAATTPKAADPVKQGLGEAEVLAYLKLHPDFLIEHTELLSVLTPPQMRRGEAVVDMQSFMLQHQRAALEKLQDQQNLLVSNSRANLASQARVHAAVLAVLAAVSFEQLIQIVTTDLGVMLDADVVTLGVESAEPMRPKLRNQGVQILRPGTVEAIFGADRDVVLESEVEGDPMLFGDGAGLVRSAALLRLKVSAAAPKGLLAIGTRRPGKFHVAQGTELLSFLANSVAITIAQWLDLPV